MATVVRREVVETSLELLLMEVVSHFFSQQEDVLTTQVVSSEKDPATNGAEEDDDLNLSEAFDLRVNIRSKIERMGYDVGQRLVERLAADKPKMETDLETVKYICKEFWEEVFKKQIDVLMTNNKGRFVLHDNHFRWIARISHNEGSLGDLEDFVVFPAGLLSGALNRLGLNCKVAVEASAPPKCVFTLQVVTPVSAT